MQETIDRENSGLSKLNPIKASRNFASAVIGSPLGVFELTIRAAGQRRHTKLYGPLYDATDKMDNAFLVAMFKKIICDEICSINESTDDTPIYEESHTENVLSDKNAAENFSKIIASDKTVSKQSVEELVKGFKSYPLAAVCRVLVLDGGFKDEKHIVLQFGRLKPMTEYATIPAFVDAKLTGHDDVVFSAQGWGLSLPIRRRLPDDLGKGYVHWIIPDDLEESSEVAVSVLKQAGFLGEIIPYIHQEVFFSDFKKSKEAQIKTLEDSLSNIKDQVKAMAVENDMLRMAMSRLQRHGTKFEPFVRHSLKEFLYYAIPTVGGYLLGSSGWGLNGGFAGVIGGLLIGAWVAGRGK